MSVSTSAASSMVSTQGSSEIDDANSDCPVGKEGKKAPEMRKGVDRSKGLKNAKGNRPGKKAREMYRTFVFELEGMVKEDPSFSLEDMQLPPAIKAAIQGNGKLKARLDKRVKEARHRYFQDACQE